MPRGPWLSVHIPRPRPGRRATPGPQGHARAAGPCSPPPWLSVHFPRGRPGPGGLCSPPWLSVHWLSIELVSPRLLRRCASLRHSPVGQAQVPEHREELAQSNARQDAALQTRHASLVQPDPSPVRLLRHAEVNPASTHKPTEDHKIRVLREVDPWRHVVIFPAVAYLPRTSGPGLAGCGQMLPPAGTGRGLCRLGPALPAAVRRGHTAGSCTESHGGRLSPRPPRSGAASSLGHAPRAMVGEGCPARPARWGMHGEPWWARVGCCCPPRLAPPRRGQRQ